METSLPHSEVDQIADESPLCLSCLAAVDPLDHACPHCGEAVGQLTPYLPFERIRWEAAGWGRLWHEMRRKDNPASFRIFLFILIAIFAWPLLLGMLVPLLESAWRWLRSLFERAQEFANRD